MASKKTSTFYLTERLTCTAGANLKNLGSNLKNLGSAVGADADVFVQLSDLNRGGTIQFADDRALVASGCLTIDQSNNALSHQTDMYPDMFGARDGVRLVVNDQLYLTAQPTAVASSKAVNVTVRVKAHVAGLTAKDWMAIAIQSTAADN